MGLSVLERQRRNKLVVQGFLTGLSVADLAEQFSLTPSTVKTILKKNKGEIQVHEARVQSAMTLTEAESVQKARSLFLLNQAAAAQVIVDGLSSDMPPAIRHRAALDILDRGPLGKSNIQDPKKGASEIPQSVIINLMQNIETSHPPDGASPPKLILTESPDGPIFSLPSTTEGEDDA